MSAVPLWFERKFEFSLPAEQFPNVLVRLRGTPARLEEMLHSVSAEVLVRNYLAQDQEPKWSAQEHAGHLRDMEPLWLARVDDFLRGGPELTVADLSNRKTHDANHNASPLGKILAEFRNARAILLDRVQQLKPEMFSRSLVHPRLKQPMRLIDHLYFVAEHDDHHLANIWELIR